MFRKPKFLAIAASAALAGSVGALTTSSAIAGDPRLIVNSADVGLLSQQTPSYIDSAGNLRVTLADESIVLIPSAAHPPIVTLTRDGSGAVNAGSSVQLSWAVQGSGVTCETAGGTEAWRSTTIGGSGSGPFIIDSNRIFELICGNSAGLSAALPLDIRVAAPLQPMQVSVSGPSNATTGGSANIGWSVSNLSADASCAFTSSPSNTTWNSRTVSASNGSDSGTANVTLSGTGNRTFTLTCSRSGQVATDSHTVSVTDVPSAVINSFSVSSSSVAAGSSVTVAASVSGSTECSLSTAPGSGVSVSGSPGWTGVTNNGTTSRQLTLNHSSTSNRNVTFTINCQPGSVSQSRSVTITPAPVTNPNCADIGPLPGTTRDSTFTSLASMFGSGVKWGQSATNYVNGERPSIQTSRYWSMAFVPDQADGRVGWGTSSGSTGQFRVRISECPNDFRTRAEAPQELAACALGLTTNNSGNLFGGPAGSGRCPLVPGQTYYLNVLLEACMEGACKFNGQLFTYP